MFKSKRPLRIPAPIKRRLELSGRCIRGFNGYIYQQCEYDKKTHTWTGIDSSGTRVEFRKPTRRRD